MMFEARTTKSPRQDNRRGINRRRKKSQHLLDVNIRSDKARAQRNQRIILFACKILIAMSVVTGIIYGCRQGLDRLFFANPNYALTQIEVTNEGTLPRQQIIATAGIQKGANIFSIDLPAARLALLDIPQVEDAQIQRVLPDTLKISISERHPIAWLANSAKESLTLDHTTALMIDASGVVLKTRAILPEFLRLPVIAGQPIDGLVIGKKIQSPEVIAALAVIQKSSDILAGRFDVSIIDLGNGYCMEIQNREQTRVRLAFDNIDSQLQRLKLLLDYCETNQRKMATVNLMVQKNVPVTFVRLDTTQLDGNPEKPADTKTTKESKTPVRKAVPVKSSNKKNSGNGKR